MWMTRSPLREAVVVVAATLVASSILVYITAAPVALPRDIVVVLVAVGYVVWASRKLAASYPGVHTDPNWRVRMGLVVAACATLTLSLTTDGRAILPAGWRPKGAELAFGLLFFACTMAIRKAIDASRLRVSRGDAVFFVVVAVIGSFFVWI
jgi:hypothetical protein